MLALARRWTAECIPSIRRRVSKVTLPYNGPLPRDVMVERLNRLPTGWSIYLMLGQIDPAYKATTGCAKHRQHRGLCRNHKARAGNHMRLSDEGLQQAGLKLPRASTTKAKA